MNKLKKFTIIIFLIACILAVGSATLYVYMMSNSSATDDKDSYTINTRFTTWDTVNGESINTILKFNHTEGIDILSDDNITFDDDALNLYKEMYKAYYALDYDSDEYNIHREEIEFSNTIHYLINLTSEDEQSNLVVACKITFDSTEDAEGITKDYVDALYIKKIELYIPNNKLGKYIPIATITNSGLELENSILYSPYKLYEKSGHTTAMYINYWSGSKVKSALMQCETWEYSVSNNENFNETFTFDWTTDINKVADSIFADLFDITYVADFEDVKELSYLDTWQTELLNLTGAFGSMHLDDPIMLSTLKCRALNDNNVTEDPAGRNLVLEYSLTDTVTGLDRVFHLVICLGGPTNDGFEIADGIYTPITDTLSSVELYEIVDGAYKLIESDETLDVSTCKYNPEHQNAYIHIDNFSILTNADGTNVSDWYLVSLTEYDIPGYIFEKIFYYVG